MFMRVPGTGAPAGAIYFGMLRKLLSYVTPLSAMSLAGAAALDASSGILALLRVSDLRPGQWIVIRLMGILLWFLPIWIARWPFYAFAYGLGGVTPHDIVAAEAVQWAAFIVVAAVCLLAGRYMGGEQAAGQTVMFSLFGFEMLFEVPRWIISLAQALFPAAMAGFESAEEVALTISRLSLVRQLFHPPSDVSAWVYASISIGIHLCVAGVAIFVLHRMAFEDLGKDSEPAAVPESKLDRILRRAQQRPRPWDDALAWQSFCFRHRGHVLVKIKSWTYLIVAGFLLATSMFEPIAAVAVTILLAFCLAGYAILLTGDCMASELKDGTVSTLAMLPFSGREIYQGWKRGVQRFCIPEVLFLTVGLGLSAIHMPMSLTYGLAIVAALWLLPSLVFLAFLQTFEGFWNSLRSCLPVATLIVIVIAAPIMAAAVSPWAGVVTFFLLAACSHAVSMERISPSFQRRAEKTA
jgi:hypothetical protein